MNPVYCDKIHRGWRKQVKRYIKHLQDPSDYEIFQGLHPQAVKYILQNAGYAANSAAYPVISRRRAQHRIDEHAVSPGRVIDQHVCNHDHANTSQLHSVSSNPQTIDTSGFPPGEPSLEPQKAHPWGVSFAMSLPFFVSPSGSRLERRIRRPLSCRQNPLRRSAPSKRPAHAF